LRKRAAIFWALFMVLGLDGCGTKPERGSSSAELSPAKAPPAAITANAPDPRPVIVALGDSLTAGLGVVPSESYPSQLQSILDAEGFRYRVVNAGVSGDTSAQGLNRLAAIRSLNPEFVIVELGANDGLRGIPISQTRSNLEETIQALQSEGIQVVLAGMQIPPNYGPEYTSEFRMLFTDLSAKYRVPLVPFFLAGVAGVPELNQDDGIHPTAEGYRKVTDNVRKTLLPLLKKKR
jgi:acyl-CoA thioesterase I